MKRFYLILLGCIVVLSTFELVGCGDTMYSGEKKLSEEIVVSDESGDIEVSTDYCVLHYPALWADRISVTVESKNGIEKVGFYGTVDNHEKQLLFEIVFNSDDGIELGKLSIDKDTVPVCMNVPELVFDETWNSDEQTTLFAMQEDLNYVVEKMRSTENFTSE